jgi:hypothetical protein
MIWVQSFGRDQVMTYIADQKDELPAGTSRKSSVCFGCGKVFFGGAVRYDGFGGPDTAQSIYLHAACASAMAQVLICDAWPNRRRES